MPGKHSAKQKRQARHIADSERARGKSSEEAERIGWATVNKADDDCSSPMEPDLKKRKSMNKAFTVMTIDAYHGDLSKARMRSANATTPYTAPPGAQPQAPSPASIPRAAGPVRPPTAAAAPSGSGGERRRKFSGTMSGATKKMSPAEHAAAPGEAMAHLQSKTPVGGSAYNPAHIKSLFELMDFVKASLRPMPPAPGKPFLPGVHLKVGKPKAPKIATAGADASSMGKAWGAKKTPLAPEHTATLHHLVHGGMNPAAVSGSHYTALKQHGMMKYNPNGNKYVTKKGRAHVSSASGAPLKRSINVDEFDEIMKSKGGEGSRGGKIAYHTKSGAPVYQSKVKKMAPEFSKMAHNWTKNAAQDKSADSHATAAKQHLVAAFYQHHAGNYADAANHLDHADHHHRTADLIPKAASISGHAPSPHDKPASSRTMKWIAKNKKATHELVHGASAHLEDKLPMTGHTKKSFNTENTMSNTYEDLFKSELGIDGDKTLIDCPHCETPITKSEIIAKARKAPKDNISSQNKDGGHSRGKKPSKGTVSLARTGDGVAQHGHGMPGAHDANKSDDESIDVEKSVTTVRGSEHVMYINNGNDEALAKAIAEGSLGQGSMISQPIDKYNSRTR